MIEYLEKDHLYVVGARLVPSVTQIIHRLMPDMYTNVPKAFLERASRYGDSVHSLIEHYALTGDIPEGYNPQSFEGIALRRYQKLQEEYDIKFVSCEKPVYYSEDDVPLYAGKFDVIGTVEGKISLIDIKTTSKYYPEYLSMQLAMYKWAIEQTENIEIEKVYCLYLPKKNLGRLIEVKLANKDILLPKVRIESFKWYEELQED